MKWDTKTTFVFVALAFGSGGCQTLNQIHYRAGVIPVTQNDLLRIILAADFGDVQQDKKTQPAKKSSADKNSKQDQESDNKKRESEEIQAARQYTEPSERIRRQSLLAVGTATTDTASETNISDTGREASEALAGGSNFTTTGVVGRSGLTAAQPTIAGAVVSRPGLQEGPAAGLGFVSPFNILTPQVNPLSGAMGRCNDLVMAGFFGGSITNCVLHFGR